MEEQSLDDSTALVEARLPCPFCGASAHSRRSEPGWMVSCSIAKGHSADAWSMTQVQAETRWNTRPTTHASTVAREARRKAFEEAAEWHDSQIEGNSPIAVAQAHSIATIHFRSLAIAAALQTGEEGSNG